MVWHRQLSIIFWPHQFFSDAVGIELGHADLAVIIKLFASKQIVCYKGMGCLKTLGVTSNKMMLCLWSPCRSPFQSVVLHQGLHRIRLRHTDKSLFRCIHIIRRRHYAPFERGLVSHHRFFDVYQKFVDYGFR